MTKQSIFFWDEPITEIQEFRLRTVEDFYTEEVLRNTLVPIITKQSKLSLRLIDWLVTNYSKKFPVVLQVSPNGYREVKNLHTTYNEWLSSNHRLCFDVFRRRERIKFELDGEVYETTVGQLVFFNYATKYGAIKFAEDHFEEIEADHAKTMREKREQARLEEQAQQASQVVEQGAEQGAQHEADLIPDPPESGGKRKKSVVETTPKRKKRQRLSRAPTNRCFMYRVPHDLVFDD